MGEEGKAKHRKLILEIEGKRVVLTYGDSQDLPETLQKLLKLLVDIE